MKKVLFLAAIMAALVTLAASAAISQQGIPIADGANPNGYSSASAPQAPGQPDAAAPDSSDPGMQTPIAPGANPTAADRLYMDQTAQNLDTLGRAAQAATTPEQAQQVSDAVDNEVNITNNYLVRREIIRQELTGSQLLGLLKGLGYWGGSTWGKAEVQQALESKILLGRFDGTTADSNEWRTFLTREEFAVGLMRTLAQAKAFAKAYTDGAITDHNLNAGAHSAIQQRLREEMHQGDVPGNFAFWMLCILGAIALLGLLWWLIWGRHRCQNGWFNSPNPIVPVVAGGNNTGWCGIPDDLMIQ